VHRCANHLRRLAITTWTNSNAITNPSTGDDPSARPLRARMGPMWWDRLVWTFVLYGWEWVCYHKSMVSPMLAGCALTHTFANISTTDSFTRPFAEHVISSTGGWYMCLQQKHGLEQ